MTTPHDKLTAQIRKAVTIIGGVKALELALGVRYQSCYGWMRRGHLPKTEWTGETRYAETIEKATHGEVKAKELLAIKPDRRAR